MHELIAPLIVDLYSDNLSVHDNTIGYIGLLLEKHTFTGSNNNPYEQMLPVPLLHIRLNDSELLVLLYALWTFAKTQRLHHGILWAMGKAKATLSFELLLDLTKQVDFNDEGTIWQMLVSLDNVVAHNKKTNTFKHQTTLVEQYGLVSWLTNLITTVKETQSINMAQHLIRLLT